MLFVGNNYIGYDALKLNNINQISEFSTIFLFVE